MQQVNKVSEFLKTVCEQIRWEKAHSMIEKEIENHIIDQKNAFIANGLDEETATDQAIKEMGDPILIGSELDRIHKPKAEWSIILLTGIILLLGFAIRMFVNYDLDMPWMLTNSIISTVVGIGCMAIVYFGDFTAIGKYSKSIFLGLIAVTIGVMEVSPIVNGQYFYVQFILLLFPTAFSGIIYNMRTKGYFGIILSGVFFVVPAFIGLSIPSFSSVFLYSLACLILLTLAIIKRWFNVKRLRAMLLVYIPTMITTMVIFFIVILNSPYRLQRLQSAINPYCDPRGAGYTQIKTMNMLANANFFGQGELGINTDCMLHNINKDYIITYLIHRLGWISFIVIMAVIFVFIIRSFILCSSQKSVLGRLVATSVLITFIMQVVIYVANNLGFQLVTPLTLPLISYGGTAKIINMILIGIMLSVFKSGDVVRDNLITATGEKSKLFEIIDGKIIIDLKKSIIK